MSTEPVSPEVFESPEFWEEHKNKILIYGAVILLALGGYGIYALTSQRKTAAAETAYAQAATAAEFQAVTHDYAGTTAAGNAALQLADKLRSEKKYDEAAAAARDFIAKYPDHPLIGGAWVSLATTYELQGKLDEALSTYQEAAVKYPEAYSTPLAMNSQARILTQQGKKEDAKRIYQDVVARYPQSLFAHEAMRELRFLKR